MKLSPSFPPISCLFLPYPPTLNPSNCGEHKTERLVAAHVKQSIAITIALTVRQRVMREQDNHTPVGSVMLVVEEVAEEEEHLGRGLLAPGS